MLRFPNPGATLDNFVRVYEAAFTALNGTIVDLYQIRDAVVAANLATSSGYTGDAAIARATRKDKSRDPLYNQLKMYAELFRQLGWLHPTSEIALNYRFTLLGQQLVAAGRDYHPLLEECALGIAHPTPLLSVKGKFHLRPFALILLVASACEGHISRDEMIYGPLNAASDRDQRSFASTVNRVLGSRASRGSAIAALSGVATSRRIKINTLRNYTRWPIAVVRDLRWMEKGRKSLKGGGSQQTWVLTDKGRALCERLRRSADLRTDDVESLAPDERSPICELAHFHMLERAGFDVSPMNARLAEAKTKAHPTLERLGASGKPLLFSPFQSLSPSTIATVFQPTADAHQKPTSAARAAGGDNPQGRGDRSHLVVTAQLVPKPRSSETPINAAQAELQALFVKHGNAAGAATKFASNHKRDTKTEFYPLVVELFHLLGFASECSRAGVNYQRWDALVRVGDYSLPIEIKSPAEELWLSTKAVRQALENKIVILARNGLPTLPQMSSLIVGYQIPNERAEMTMLIDDVFAAYQIRLGVVDLTTLAHLALRSIYEGITVAGEQLSELKGFLGV